MFITVKQAKKLEHGRILYHVSNQNADGTPQRWRVNGRPKTWKRSPDRVRVPLKDGLYSYGYLTEDNIHLFSLVPNPAPEPVEIDGLPDHFDLNIRSTDTDRLIAVVPGLDRKLMKRYRQTVELIKADVCGDHELSTDLAYVEIIEVKERW